MKGQTMHHITTKKLYTAAISFFMRILDRAKNIGFEMGQFLFFWLHLKFLV